MLRNHVAQLAQHQFPKYPLLRNIIIINNLYIGYLRNMVFLRGMLRKLGGSRESRAQVAQVGCASWLRNMRKMEGAGHGDPLYAAAQS